MVGDLMETMIIDQLYDSLNQDLKVGDLVAYISKERGVHRPRDMLGIGKIIKTGYTNSKGYIGSDLNIPNLKKKCIWVKGLGVGGRKRMSNQPIYKKVYQKDSSVRIIKDVEKVIKINDPTTIELYNDLILMLDE